MDTGIVKTLLQFFESTEWKDFLPFKLFIDAAKVLVAGNRYQPENAADDCQLFFG